MSSPLRRLSLALRLTTPYKPHVVPDSATLAQFLSTSKAKYLKDVQEKAGEASKWTVVMGNEAGDLDTIASSIAFAWMQSEVHENPTIPLMQFEVEDLNLRAENIYALNLAGINNPKEQLLTLTDISGFKPFPSQKFALVDHNRLGASFAEGNPSSQVIAVVDHHDDEGLYSDANPRIVAPAGSCTSHITTLLPSKIPPELATILLCAMLIDTNGLKLGGKALQVDQDSAASLAPRSTFAPSISSAKDDPLYEQKAIKDLTATLLTKKSDVSHLNGHDLLRRDYKEYTFILSWVTNGLSIKAGLSTVPVRLEDWGSGGRLETDTVTWMKTRGLTVLGVLTSFRAPSRVPGKNAKGKHKREMAWIVLDSSAPTVLNSDSAALVDIDELASRLWKGLEDDKELQVRKHKKFKNIEGSGKLPPKSRARVYKQGNPNATRKAVAPLLKNILQGPTANALTEQVQEQ